jgi:hypothetical protein
MLKTYVILVCHQECANYRAFVDSPVVCAHNCNWSTTGHLWTALWYVHTTAIGLLCLPELKQNLFSHCVPPLLS